MAETSAKNEAFLKQMERQRLGKLCNRAIDLRGKVPGECRVYEFGGKKHYLDDRGYLLAKQLLDRFNGRYTIGVYETVLKALKKLSSNDDNVAERESDKPILLRDENHVQFMRFDQEVKRKEPRLTTVTPVHLSINDVVYQGSTIDITTSAIRVSLKRASTISSGIEINVSLPEIAEKSDISSFTKITYKVLKISHDELRTQLVLLRNRHDNPAVTKWLDNWIARKQSPEHLDLNNELYNLTNRIYMRLYNETRSKPLFWLTPTADIDTLHLTTSAAAHLTALRDDSGSFIFSRLPLAELPLHAEQFLLAVNSEGYAVASATDTEKLKQLVAWKNQNSNGFLLLLNQSARLIDEDDLAEFEEEIEALNKYNTDYAEKFKQNILTQHRVISITDITDSFNYIHVDSPIAELTTHGDTPVDIATPKEFNHFINRTVERYTIRTEVRARVNGKAYNLKTNDASEAGLSITLPEYVDLLPDTRINLDFTRWQAMAKETRLRGIQFRAKWIKYWQGQTILGLAREKRACSASVNKFFHDVIDINKAKLTVEYEHLRIAPESIIFSGLITPVLKSTPFYLTMDDNNVRIIQAVATTPANNASNKAAHWKAMQTHLRQLWSQAKVLADKPDNTLNFSLYSYLNSQQEWQIKTEQEFTSPSEKNLFINQALTAHERYFYHGSLTSIKTEQVTDQEDIYQKLIELRSHSQHKVKQIRQILHTLFAIGEFTDITDVIAAAYR